MLESSCPRSVLGSAFDSNTEFFLHPSYLFGPLPPAATLNQTIMEDTGFDVLMIGTSLTEFIVARMPSPLIPFPKVGTDYEV